MKIKFKKQINDCNSNLKKLWDAYLLAVNGSKEAVEITKLFILHR